VPVHFLLYVEHSLLLNILIHYNAKVWGKYSLKLKRYKKKNIHYIVAYYQSCTLPVPAIEKAIVIAKRNDMRENWASYLVIPWSQ